MNYTLRQLAAFRAIDNHRNITRAAKELGLTQSGLSAMLRELEAEAGEALFSRTTRRLEPTPAGVAFRPLAERVLQESAALASTFRDYRSGGRGLVRLGLMPSLAAVVLPDLLREFRRTHPLVEIDLVEAHAGTLSEMVQDGSLSVALGTAFALGRDLHHDHLWQDEIVAVLPEPDGSDPLQWSDLAKRDFVAIKDSASLRTLSDAGFRVSGGMPRTMIEVGSMATAIAFVRAGFGCTILPRSALAMLVSDGLTIRPLVAPALARDISMITPAQVPNAATAALCDLILRKAATYRNQRPWTAADG
ncbi:MAG: LysR family transcriptional regulator [Frigidibacter sp.]|nr:LysR family transcriptional regulator [Frigidibacter sp.]